MSSLRLALKQSLENSNNNNNSNTNNNNNNTTSLNKQPTTTTTNPTPTTPYGLSDKQLRRRIRTQKTESKHFRKLRKLRRITKKQSRERRKEQAAELQRCIDNGGTTLELDKVGRTGKMVGLKTGDGGRDGGEDSSTLSSSSSGSSSSSDSSSSSSSSSSTSSSTSDSSSSDSSSSDDDDSLSSSEEEGEVKDKALSGDSDDDDSSDGDNDDDDNNELNSDSSSDDSSDDTIEAADRETKELFDADLSSDEGNNRGGGGQMEDADAADDDDDGEDDERRHKRMKNKTKKLKAKKKKDDAANMIANRWKGRKKSNDGNDGGGEGGEKREKQLLQHSGSQGSGMTNASEGGASSGTSKTVQPPAPLTIRHHHTLPPKTQRKSISIGLRVKVRFVKKANVNGRLTRKLKWYGGVVSGVANGGRKIKIQYDDGTSEVADFPDKDVVVDGEGNGAHGGANDGGTFAASEPAGEESVNEEEVGSVVDAGSDGDADADDESSDESGEIMDDEKGGVDEAGKEEGEMPEEGLMSKKKKKKKSLRQKKEGIGAEEEGGGDIKGETTPMKKKKKKKKKKSHKDVPRKKKSQYAKDDSESMPIPRGRSSNSEEPHGTMDTETQHESYSEKLHDTGKASRAALPNNAATKETHSSDMSISSSGITDGEEAPVVPVAATEEEPPASMAPMPRGAEDKDSSEEEGELAEEEEGEGIVEDAEMGQETSQDEGVVPAPTKTEPSKAHGSPLDESLESGELPGGDGPEEGELPDDKQVERPSENTEKDDGDARTKESTGGLPAKEEPQEETKEKQHAVEADSTTAALPNPKKSEEKDASSSSSGSTCSNSSFAGVVTPAVSTTKEKTSTDLVASPDDDASPPSHVDVEKPTGEKENEEEDVEMTDEKNKAEISGETKDAPVGDGVNATAATAPSTETAGVEQKEPQQEQEGKEHTATKPPPEKKKRGPLSIRIGLPKRKKQQAEEQDLKVSPTGTTAEPSAKKQKLSVAAKDEETGTAELYSKLEDSSAKKPPTTEETATPASMALEDSATTSADSTRGKGELKPEAEMLSAKDKDDDSLSDGEIEEEGEIQEEDGEIQEKDGAASPMDEEVEAKTASESTKEDRSSEEPKQKKPKLSIHISTKKLKQRKENKIDETKATTAAEDEDESQKKVEKNRSLKEQPDTTGKLTPTAEVDESEKKVPADDIGAEDKDSTTDGKISGIDKTPTSNEQSPAPQPEDGGSGDGDGDGKPFSMARSGRKAAKRAAEKISAEKKEKSKKKTEKNERLKKKAEEDPWVQCDRCHKWRHLPGTVDLDSLPEHWFCELNTYDAKRNNCEASEQTPKEVAKEKKRAKKLALKKQLQMEHAQAQQATVVEAGREAGELVETTVKLKGRRGRSTSPKNGSDQETEFHPKSTTDEKVLSVDFDVAARGRTNTDEDDETTTNASSRGATPPPIKPKPKRGRPRRDDKEKEKASSSGGKGKDGKRTADQPKQEWVQCEKCEKWRRLPPRISAEDLPDVWYCSMNTWDINLATCTAIEDKHEANSPQRGGGKPGTSGASPNNSKEFNETTQIPTGFGIGSISGSSKLSYRNLIFGSGRRQKNISERMRAQESLFSSQHEEEADMSMPPTVMYANSKVFYNKSLINKATSFDDEQQGGGGGGGGSPSPSAPTSIFDIVSSSHVWQELNNNASTFHVQNVTAYNAVGYDKYCQSNGSLNQEAVDTLKAMAYFGLGTKTLVGHEILLEVQSQGWNVPAHWIEIRSLCTIEIITYILDELMKDGLVEVICTDPNSLSLSLENAFYRRRPGPGEEHHAAPLPSAQEVIDQRSSCLKIRKPWKE